MERTSKCVLPKKGREKIVIKVLGRSSSTLLSSPPIIFLDFVVFVLFFSFLKKLYFFVIHFLILDTHFYNEFCIGNFVGFLKKAQPPGSGLSNTSCCLVPIQAGT